MAFSGCLRAEHSAAHPPAIVVGCALQDERQWLQDKRSFEETEMLRLKGRSIVTKAMCDERLERAIASIVAENEAALIGDTLDDQDQSDAVEGWLKAESETKCILDDDFETISVRSLDCEGDYEEQVARSVVMEQMEFLGDDALSFPCDGKILAESRCSLASSICESNSQGDDALSFPCYGKILAESRCSLASSICESNSQGPDEEVNMVIAVNAIHGINACASADGSEKDVVTEEDDVDIEESSELLQSCTFGFFENSHRNIYEDRPVFELDCRSGISTCATGDDECDQEGHAQRFAKEQMEQLSTETLISARGIETNLRDSARIGASQISENQAIGEQVDNYCAPNHKSVELAMTLQSKQLSEELALQSLVDSDLNQSMWSNREPLPIARLIGVEDQNSVKASSCDLQQISEVAAPYTDPFKAAVKLGSLPDRAWSPVSIQSTLVKHGKKLELNRQERETKDDAVHDTGNKETQVATFPEQQHLMELRKPCDDPFKSAVRLGDLPTRSWSSQVHDCMSSTIEAIPVANLLERRCESISCRSDELRRRCAEKLIKSYQDGNLETIVGKVACNRTGNDLTTTDTSLTAVESGEQVENCVPADTRTRARNTPKSRSRNASKSRCESSTNAVVSRKSRSISPIRNAIRLGRLPDRRSTTHGAPRKCYQAAGSPLNACRAGFPSRDSYREWPDSFVVACTTTSGGKSEVKSKPMDDKKEATVSQIIPYGFDTGTYINAMLEARLDKEKDRRPGAGLRMPAPKIPVGLQMERSLDAVFLANSAQIAAHYNKAQAGMSTASTRFTSPRPPSAQRVHTEMTRPRRPMSAR